MKRVLSAILTLTALPALAAAPTYTTAQATQGAATYKSQCAMCHGSTLDNGGAPKLVGDNFKKKWSGHTVDDFHYIMSTTMPQTNPGGLKPAQYVNLVAYVLQKNGYKPGKTALTAATLKSATFNK